MKHVGGKGPAYLVVAQDEQAQRHAAAVLIRPAEVGVIASSLARRCGPSWPAGDLVAGWLRGFHYFADPPWADVWRSPRATLALGGGDCEDLAIAGISLLLALGGYGVLVIGIYYSHTGPIGHAWMEGSDGAGWLHIDA